MKNIPKNYQEPELTKDYLIPRKAVDLAIPMITHIQLAEPFVEAQSRKGSGNLKIASWAKYSVYPAFEKPKKFKNSGVSGQTHETTRAGQGVQKGPFIQAAGREKPEAYTEVR